MLRIERVPAFSPVREDLYRLRYAAYVGACPEYRDWLDHSSRAVHDDLDESGHTYGAFADGELVGTGGDGIVTVPNNAFFLNRGRPGRSPAGRTGRS